MRCLPAFLFLNFLMLGSLLGDTEVPAVIIYNNSADTVVVGLQKPGESGARKVTEVASMDRYRAYTEADAVWAIYRKDGAPMVSYTITATPALQTVFALKPRPQDIERSEQLEKAWAEAEIARSNAAWEQQKKQMASDREKKLATFTGFFQMPGGFFFQETSHQDPQNPARWSYRSNAALQHVQQVFEELKRTPDGVELKVPNASSYILLTQSEVKTRTLPTSGWIPMSNGSWEDRSAIMDAIQAKELEIVVAKQQMAAAETKNQEPKSQPLQNAQSEEEKEPEVAATPDFEVTRVFDISNGLLVNVSAKRWEFWQNDNFDDVISYREISRDGNGVTLQQEGEAFYLRLQENDLLYANRLDEPFRAFPNQGEYYEWLQYESIRDLREDRKEAEVVFREKEAKELAKWWGADPELMQEIRQHQDWLSWIDRDQENAHIYKEEINISEQDTFAGRDYMRRGVNILKMEPGRPSISGLGSSSKYLLYLEPNVEPTWEDSSINKKLPFSLSARYRGLVVNEMRSEMYTNSDQRTKSESLNVSLKVGIGDEDSKVGYSNKTESTKAKESSRTTIRTEVRGYYADLIIDKRYLVLHPDLRSRIMGAIDGTGAPLKTQAQFEEFFKTFGTHWVIRSMIGGKMWTETTIEASALSDIIAKETTVSADLSVPVKGGSIGGGYEYSVGEVNEKASSNKLMTSVTKGFGGDLVADMEEWTLDPGQTETMEPLRVMLRPVSELIRPQLFPITKWDQVNAIHELAVLMDKALDTYIKRETANYNPPPPIFPMMVEVSVSAIECRTATDGGLRDSYPDVSGEITIEDNGQLVATPLSISEDDYIEMKPGDKTKEPSGSYKFVVMPSYEKDAQGRWRIRIPEHQIVVSGMLTEWDTGSSQRFGGVNTHEIGGLVPFVNRDFLIPQDMIPDHSTSVKMNLDHAGSFFFYVTIYAKKIQTPTDHFSHPGWFDF